MAAYDNPLLKTGNDKKTGLLKRKAKIPDQTERELYTKAPYNYEIMTFQCDLV